MNFLGQPPHFSNQLTLPCHPIGQRPEAGVLDRCMLPELTSERLQRTTKPKAHGVLPSAAEKNR